MMRMRIYGKATKIGDGYWEIEYKDIDENGRVINEGTEDFSSERMRNINTYEIRGFQGRKNINGSEMTYPMATIRILKGTSPSKIAKALYGDKVARVVKC